MDRTTVQKSINTQSCTPMSKRDFHLAIPGVSVSVRVRLKQTTEWKARQRVCSSALRLFLAAIKLP